MAQKKKSKEKVETGRLRKDDEEVEVKASKKAPKKAPKAKPRKKPAAKKTGAGKNQVTAKKNGAGKDEETPGTGKQRKARVSDAVERNNADETTKRQQDPFEIARQTMKGSVPAIVETMVELAKQGSCSHAKTLLEMTGAKYMFEEEAESHDKGEPWAKLVLERLGEAESSQEQEISVRDASSEELIEQ